MKKAFGVYASMLESKVQPSRVTFNTLLDTCAQMSGRGGGGGEGKGGVATAKFLISRMKEEGIEPDAVSYTCFINCARKDGSREAVESAYDIFRALPNNKLMRNKHTYTSMVRALSSVGRWQEAMGLLDEAKLTGIRPDRIMYSVCMEAVGHDRDLVRCPPPPSPFPQPPQTITVFPCFSDPLFPLTFFPCFTVSLLPSSPPSHPPPPSCARVSSVLSPSLLPLHLISTIDGSLLNPDPQP